MSIASQNAELLANLGIELADENGPDRYKGFKISDLKAISKQHFDKEHWMNPFYAIVRPEEVGALVAAIEFYLADEPEVRGPHEHENPRYKGNYVVISNGYRSH